MNFQEKYLKYKNKYLKLKCKHHQRDKIPIKKIFQAKTKKRNLRILNSFQ